MKSNKMIKQLFSFFSSVFILHQSLLRVSEGIIFLIYDMVTMLINQDNGLLIWIWVLKWPGFGVNLKDYFQYIKV